MTSNLPSILNDFNAVAISGNSCNSSKIINVSPSMNFLDVSIIEIFFIISSTAYPSLSIVLYFGSNTKLILTILPYFWFAKWLIDSVFPICLAPFIINGSLSSFSFHSNRYSSIFLFKYIESPPFFKAITFYEPMSIYFSRFMSLYL